jgi:hypothetical protein
MALQGLGHTVTARDLARHLPFHVDGTDFFDLQQELARRGFHTLVWVGGSQDAASALVAGLPVIAAVKAGTTKHTVLLEAVQFEANCSGSPEVIHLVDPREGARRELTALAFEQWQMAGQLLVIWKSEDVEAARRLVAAGFPLASARSTNARFRSTAWVRRAAMHAEPNRDMVTLLDNALNEDPCWSLPWERMHETLTALQQNEEWAAYEVRRASAANCEPQ